MPVITRFYGIVVKMYPNDHTPPHFHAIYGEYVGVIDINTLDMIEGDLSNRALGTIKKILDQYARLFCTILRQQVVTNRPAIRKIYFLVWHKIYAASLVNYFSSCTLKLVKEWAEKYQKELIDMWNTKIFRKLEGLE